MARLPLVLLTALGLLAAACGGDDDDDTSTPDPAGEEQPSTTTTAPVIDSIAFYYQQIEAGDDLARLGPVEVVITNEQHDPEAAVAAIRAIGARPFRGVEPYWVPSETRNQPIDLRGNPDWAFCLDGDEKVAFERRGEDWWLIDANERTARERYTELLAEIDAEGWDGVFVDRGLAAFTGVDIADLGVWNQVSSCTEDPVTPGATLSDVFVELLAEADEAGFEVALNYGHSPFFPDYPMRPDPADPDCPDGPDCTTLDDVWPHIDFAVNEAPAHPKDQLWERDFVQHQTSEQHPRFGGRVVSIITTGTLGGQEYNRKDDVYFQWARVRLFDIPTTANTGDDECGGTVKNLCNRYGVYAELNVPDWGRPVEAQPTSRDCDSGSDVACVWTRAYERGISVVNVSGAPRTVTVDVPGDECRVVVDIHSQTELAGGECVDDVTLDLPGYSGRPLRLVVGT